MQNGVTKCPKGLFFVYVFDANVRNGIPLVEDLSADEDSRGNARVYFLK